MRRIQAVIIFLLKDPPYNLNLNLTLHLLQSNIIIIKIIMDNRRIQTPITIDIRNLLAPLHHPPPPPLMVQISLHSLRHLFHNLKQRHQNLQYDTRIKFRCWKIWGSSIQKKTTKHLLSRMGIWMQLLIFCFVESQTYKINFHYQYSFIITKYINKKESIKFEWIFIFTMISFGRHLWFLKS